MRRVIFLCTGNSCRSQMAEGLLRELGQGSYETTSAGTIPSTLNPLAVRAMSEIGIDISAQTSKGLDAVSSQTFDLAVTVCDNARETCPYFPGATDHLHWSFDDPAEAVGTEDERMAVFRRVRDEIRDRLQTLLSG